MIKHSVLRIYVQIFQINLFRKLQIIIRISALHSAKYFMYYVQLALNRTELKSKIVVVAQGRHQVGLDLYFPVLSGSCLLLAFVRF